MCYVAGEEHMDMTFQLPERTCIGGAETELTLREIIRRLEQVYCGSMGVEYMHVHDIDCLQFVRERMERPGVLEKTPDQKRLIMRRLTKATFLERYFATKWPAEKRFGLEGGESLIVMMEEIVDTSTEFGIESIVMGMPHRGRLNVLVNVCRKQLTDIFTQFKPMEPKDRGSGDIKYHLGTYIHRFIRKTSKYIKVSLSANPSHLEVVSPVVQGKCRAEQFWRGDNTGDKVMSILMHGDAAFSGQGVVYETMHLSDLPSFTTRGTIHIVVNNQIGYTTDPRFSRSSAYCTGKALITRARLEQVFVITLLLCAEPLAVACYCIGVADFIFLADTSTSPRFLTLLAVSRQLLCWVDMYSYAF
ncbi:2-oxoglutarate dehydrogenase-like, mitochondrial [Eumeta japonica]|uniref:2-oxoglutarate dehydrogenase-like, mitochondrial n=1 Tax=Eumeta variegata TaxID=151549 RepID=A0A4C1VZR7_EUMVA|nr:2-oxoglutarate dehydrogenase-like, mitochondrial [Eumeta japonica]